MMEQGEGSGPWGDNVFHPTALYLPYFVARIEKTTSLCLILPAKTDERRSRPEVSISKIVTLSMFTLPHRPVQ